MRLDRPRVAVAVAGFAAFLDLYATQALLPVLAGEFQASTAQLGATITAATLAVALSAPLSGLIADLAGRKRVIVAAALLLVLPTVGIAFVDSLSAMLVLRFLQGLCLPAMFAVTVAYISEEWEPGQSADVTGLYVAGTILGGFTGRLLVGAVSEAAGWREGFMVLGALNLACALVIWGLLPPARAFRPTAGMRSGLGLFAAHLGNGRLLATCGVGFVILFSLVAAFTFANFLLAGAPFRLSETQLGAVFAVYLLGVMLSPLAGRLVERLGRRATVVVAFGLAAAGLVLSLLPSLPTIIGGLALCAGGVFIVQATAMSAIGRLVSGARSAAVGLYSAIYYLGGSLGAVAPAVAWDTAGWAGCVALVITVQGLGVALALWAWRPEAPAVPAPVLATTPAATDRLPVKADAAGA